MNGKDNGIEPGLSPTEEAAPLPIHRKEHRDMTTETTDRAEVFSRPAARFDEDGQLEVRASSALGCRRALWYAATGYEPTNPPTEESLTAMEAGNALEPVVVRAMGRAGWKVDAADPHDPERVSMRLGPNPVSGTGQALLVVGHPDATGRMPLEQSLPPTGSGDETAPPQLFLFDDEPQDPAHSDPMVLEIKTRGPEAFRRWQTLGAERSHRRRWPRPPSTPTGRSEDGLGTR